MLDLVGEDIWVAVLELASEDISVTVSMLAGEDICLNFKAGLAGEDI